MFDTALIESAPPHAGLSSRTARTLPLALGFHAAVIASLVVSALASTAEPPEPKIPIVLPDIGRQSPPPAPAGARSPIKTSVVPRTPVDTAPDRIPENTVVPAIEESARIEDAGAEGTSSGFGEPDGAWDGVEGGLPGGTGTKDGGGLDSEDEAVLRPGVGGVTVPELIERVEPRYPETARKLRQEGTVVLEAVITTAGAVDEVRVVASAGPLLDAAALSAVRRWRYRPATLNGRAVAVFLAVTVRFGLGG